MARTTRLSVGTAYKDIPGVCMGGGGVDVTLLYTWHEQLVRVAALLILISTRCVCVR